MLMFGWDFEFWNLIKICVRTCYFGKQNSTLGPVVPLAMFPCSLDIWRHQILNSNTELQISFLPHGNWTCEMQEIPIHSWARNKMYLLNSAYYLTIGNALNDKDYLSDSYRFSFLSEYMSCNNFSENKVKEGCIWRTMRHLSMLFSCSGSLFIDLSYLASTSSYLKMLQRC